MTIEIVVLVPFFSVIVNPVPVIPEMSSRKNPTTPPKLMVQPVVIEPDAITKGAIALLMVKVPLVPDTARLCWTKAKGVDARPPSGKRSFAAVGVSCIIEVAPACR
jgi:hypothetical protein